MKLMTEVQITPAPFTIEPCEQMLFVGSCFADYMGKRFAAEKFRTLINPYGVMYNPASLWHTVGRCADFTPRVSVLTLGTNRVYRLRETGEIVDNCQKRPAKLFEEEPLSLSDCVCYLSQSIDSLLSRHPEARVVLTVSPVRYAKYGFHGSRLSKAVLLLAVDQAVQKYGEKVSYFPAYELMNDELRDYRFYAADMLHPSEQAVDYIFQRFADTYFSAATKEFLVRWKPLKEALAHRPFRPESPEHRHFMEQVNQSIALLSQQYPDFEL